MFSLCMFVVLMLNFGFNNWVFFRELRVTDPWSSVNVLKLSTFFFVFNSGFSMIITMTLARQHVWYKFTQSFDLNMQLVTVVSISCIVGLTYLFYGGSDYAGMVS